MDQLREQRVANFPISKNLDDFDKTLSSLLSSISKYEPQQEYATQLVEIESNLHKSLEDLITHQRSGLEIDSIESYSNQLDENCVTLLLKLNECRKILLKYPNSNQVNEEKAKMNSTSLSTHLLLQYAMKLAKFTTTPPTFDMTSIGPNNFIWPAEDSLRRGTLALASLNANKLIGEEELKADTNDKDNKSDVDQKSTENNEPASKPKRRGSFGGSYGDHDDEIQDDVIEDLDLFDPDDL